MNIDTLLKLYIISKVIIIQRYVRKYIARKNDILIIPSQYQTKEWRKIRKWYKNGKSNECEKYQLSLLQKITNNIIVKTNDRIHTTTNKIVDIKHPYTKVDGFEYSENFDGLLKLNNKKFYFNLKFVCDNGGAQTRTLKDVYSFIEHQLEFLLKHNYVYFINILDGDCSYKNIDKFSYLYKKDKYKSITKFIFIGDLCLFQIYKNSIFAF